VQENTEDLFTLNLNSFRHEEAVMIRKKGRRHNRAMYYRAAKLIVNDMPPL
jgi:hypothetical protein